MDEWLKITAIRCPGSTAYGPKEGRRKAPVYNDAAWVVFDKAKEDHPSWPATPPKVILAKFQTADECREFIRQRKATTA